MSYRYDEAELVTRLRALSPAFRTAFAAACAERLFPAYGSIQSRVAVPSAAAPRMILDEVWNGIETRETIEREELLMSLLSSKTEDSAATAPYAEDALAAIAYAVRVNNSGESQEAAWAARRAYEALDQYVLHQTDVQFNQPGVEEEILEHPAIQTELHRQDEDLRDLADAEISSSEDVIRQLRVRAVANAYMFLGRGITL